MKKITQTLMAVAIASVAAQAQAATYEYDFRVWLPIEKTQDSKTYSQPDGLDMTLSAGATSNGGTPLARKLYIDAFGVGAWSGGNGQDGTIDLDSHGSLDNGNDYLKFTFNKKVTLKSVSFSYFDVDDKAKVFTVDSTGMHMVGSLGPGITGWGPYQQTSLGLNALGDTFMVAASDWVGPAGVLWQTTDIRVTGITVDYQPTVTPPVNPPVTPPVNPPVNPPTPNPVPEPGSIALVSIALLGLGLSRRRK